MPRPIASHAYLARASARPLSPMARARTGSSRRRARAAPTARASWGTQNPQPAASTSCHGTVRVTTTGTAAAIASSTLRPKLSESEHSTRASASARSAHLSASPTLPSSARILPGSEQRLDAAAIAGLIRPGDRQSRRPVARPDRREGRGEHVQSLDRVQAAEEHDQGRALRQARSQTKAPASGSRVLGGVDAVRQHDDGHAGHAPGERPRLGLGGRVKECGAREMAALQRPGRDALAPARDARASRRRACPAERSRTGSAPDAHGARPSIPAGSIARGDERDRAGRSPTPAPTRGPTRRRAGAGTRAGSTARRYRRSGLPPGARRASSRRHWPSW